MQLSKNNFSRPNILFSRLKQRLIQSLAYLSILFFALPLYANANTPIPVPTLVPSEPTIDANAYLLVDFNSGKELAAKDADQQIEPASLTKIMTGYVVLNELKRGTIKMTDMVTISQKAWQMPGSKMFIEVGKEVSVDDLIKGMVIQSGNDASVALAEHVAGSEEAFVGLMNKYAQLLGMNGTHYENATGLPSPEHYTTAKDLALLAKALIEQFPDDYKRYEQKKFTFNGITQYNRNKLLWQDPSVDGLKTGHTESAGYCLVSSAVRNNMRLISIVLGTKSSALRISESQKLINFGYRFYETHQIYATGQRLQDTRIWEGQVDTLGLGLASDLYVTIPRGNYKNLVIDLTPQPNATAPIEKGQIMGKLTVSLNGELLSEKPLVALSAIEAGGFFKKLFDQIKRLFNSILAMFGFE